MTLFERTAPSVGGIVSTIKWTSILGLAGFVLYRHRYRVEALLEDIKDSLTNK